MSYSVRSCYNTVNFCNVKLKEINPDSKVHGVNMGPIWGRQDPGGPYVGAMEFVIWVDKSIYVTKTKTLFKTISN